MSVDVCNKLQYSIISNVGSGRDLFYFIFCCVDWPLIWDVDRAGHNFLEKSRTDWLLFFCSCLILRILSLMNLIFIFFCPFDFVFVKFIENEGLNENGRKTDTFSDFMPWIFNWGQFRWMCFQYFIFVSLESWMGLGVGFVNLSAEMWLGHKWKFWLENWNMLNKKFCDWNEWLSMTKNLQFHF